jgi:hypothetical protein
MSVEFCFSDIEKKWKKEQKIKKKIERVKFEVVLKIRIRLKEKIIKMSLTFWLKKYFSYVYFESEIMSKSVKMVK